MKILVVDDEKNNRVVLKTFLKKFGEVVEAENGEECIERYKMSLQEDNPFDLILLDIMMPKMDGHQALKNLREFEETNDIQVGEGVKIIMVTALDDGKNFTQSFREGCEGYVMKPITKENLFKSIQSLGISLN